MYTPPGELRKKQLSLGLVINYHNNKFMSRVKNYFKPISISLSPNVEKDDLHLALNLLIRPWLWKHGKAIKKLENEFKDYLGVKYAFSFNSGRSSLFAILKALDLPKESGVLLQAFTCNASINPILWAELKPVYIDCNEDDFNVDINDLKKKIAENHNAKVLMVQHTFGLPANMDEVNIIVRQNGLILIEDCAHSLGAEYKKVGLPAEAQWAKMGTFGKVAFFSFSRDKIISSVYGGVAVTNDDEIGKNLEALQKSYKQPTNLWTLQQILHPILLHYFILPVYNFLDLGKVFLVLSQYLHILSKAVSWKEKRGIRPDYFPRALPNALAAMALNQFGKLEKFEKQRANIAESYYNELADSNFKLPAKFNNRKNAFLRFTVKIKNAQDIIYEAWHNQNILLGDWYTTPIAPFDTKLEEMHYKMGMCPNAEYLAKHTLNLPTHINISKQDFVRIIKFLKSCGKK
jgi:dTDP-4-amino-4,6-dideoxygalactose transaminase